MSHPLEEVIRKADGFVLIGDSSEGRFPAMSYHSYSKVGKRFYCLDLGGLKESRGPTKGGRVYSSVEELPEDRNDLAVIWIKPRSAAGAVEVAHQAGCKRVWFSYKSGHRDAVARAGELGMEVVEVGRCPVYYMDAKAPGCKAHEYMVRATRLYRRPPSLEADPDRREIL
jgi:hypothetical protein